MTSWVGCVPSAQAHALIVRSAEHYTVYYVWTHCHKTQEQCGEHLPQGTAGTPLWQHFVWCSTTNLLTECVGAMCCMKQHDLSIMVGLG